MLLMIDNYDSFTYNVVQYFGELGADVQVYRNDEITLEEMDALNPDHLVISPGPCTPKKRAFQLLQLSTLLEKYPFLVFA